MGIFKKSKKTTKETEMSATETQTPQTERKTTYLAAKQIQRGENFGRYYPAPTEDKVESLANSIKEHGQLAPVLVRQNGDGYHLIAGFTRTAACEKLNRDVWCEILEGDESSDLDRSVEENRKRADLTLIDTAAIMQRYIDRGMTGAKVAAKLGVTPAWVTNCRKLLTLPDAIKDAVARGKLSGQAGIALCKLANDDDRMAAFADAAKAVANPARDSSVKGEVIDADCTQLSDDVLDQTSKHAETYDSGRILKWVAKKTAPAPTPVVPGSTTAPNADGETTAGGSMASGETPIVDGGKVTARKLIEDYTDVLRRSVNNAPISAPLKEFLTASITYLCAGSTKEKFETEIAEFGGFQTSALYLAEETKSTESPAA